MLAAMEMVPLFDKTIKKSMSFKELETLINAVTDGRLSYTKAIAEGIAQVTDT